MKLADLFLIEAETKPIIAYHATSVNNLRSIIKNGMIPNKESGGYASGEKSPAGYSLTAMPGIYFYKDSHNAYNLAKSLSVRNNSDTAIIVCQVQPKTTEMDEDRLNDDGLLDDKVIIKLAKSGVDGHELEREAVILLIQNLQKKGLNNNTIKAASPVIKEYVRALITFARDPQSENQMRQHKNELTKKLRKLVVYDKSQHSFKINEPIGYSGSNKIIGIMLVSKSVGWRKLRLA